MGRLKTQVEILGYEEIRSVDFYVALVAEFLGTLLLVFLGCGAAISAPNIISVAFTFGISLASIIQVLGHVSGAHVNPAVSIGMLVARFISVTRFFAYVIVQVLGAITASGLLYAIVPKAIQGNLGAAEKIPGMNDGEAFGMEVMLTFVLVFVIMGSTDERRRDVSGSVPLAIGLSLAVAIMCGGPLSGAGINPARCLGPMVILPSSQTTEIWNYHWVYWVGPLLGGTLGALSYTYVFRAKKVASSSSSLG